MSYARLSHCDVYVFLSVGGHLKCCMCSLGPDITATKTDDMVAHLDAHRAAGHDVPDDTYTSLREDQKVNDRWMRLVADGVDEDAAWAQAEAEAARAMEGQ
jgi:hypothetical protein